MTHPTREALDALIVRVQERVAELPDRTSPDDWPEAMLVTHDELAVILREELADAFPALPHQQEGERRPTAWDVLERLTGTVSAPVDWAMGEAEQSEGQAGKSGSLGEPQPSIASVDSSDGAFREEARQHESVGVQRLDQADPTPANASPALFPDSGLRDGLRRDKLFSLAIDAEEAIQQLRNAALDVCEELEIATEPRADSSLLREARELLEELVGNVERSGECALCVCVYRSGGPTHEEGCPIFSARAFLSHGDEGAK